MAELDTRLPLLVKPAEIQDPTEALRRVGHLRGMQSQQQLRDLQVAEAQRQVAEQQQLRSLGAASLVTDPATGTVTFDPKKYLPGLAKVNPQLAMEQQGKMQTQALATQKAGIEGKKAQMELDKGQIELHLQQLGILEGLLSGVTDQASYDAAKAQFAQLFPQMPIQAPAQYDPGWVRGLGESLVDAKTRLEQDWKQMDFQEKQRHNLSQEQIARGGQAVQLRGQDIGAMTAGAGHAIQREGHQVQRDVAAENRAAAQAGMGQLVPTEEGYVGINPRTGVVRPVQGPGGSALMPQPTEAQSAARGFGTRAQEANAMALQLEQQGVSTANEQALLGKLPAVGNYFLTPELQQYKQAQLDFVTAVLRKESGAAIGEEEYKREERKYFPVPGDSPQVIQQKAVSRQRQVEMLAKQSGGRVASSGQGTPRAQQSGGGTRTMSMDTIRGLAQKRGVPVEQVLQDAAAAGFTVR